MATKITHPYFGTLDTSSVEGMWDGDHTNVLWEQEITYKDNLVLVDFWLISSKKNWNMSLMILKLLFPKWRWKFLIFGTLTMREMERMLI